jgi:hypothetical protein
MSEGMCVLGANKFPFVALLWAAIYSLGIWETKDEQSVSCQGCRDWNDEMCSLSIKATYASRYVIR